MKINISDIPKDTLLAGLYKFATIQGIGYVEQAALGSLGKPFILLKEAILLNEHQKNKTGKLYFTSLFGKNLFVDISKDEVDFTAYDFHNGSGLGSVVVGLARTNPSFLFEPISDMSAHIQMYCAINACYQEIPLNEFNTLVSEGKIEELTNRLYSKYRKTISNHTGFPLTVVSASQNYTVVRPYDYDAERRAAMGCFYQEIAVEEMPAASALARCEKALNDAIAFLGAPKNGVFNTPLVRRDTRLLPIKTNAGYALFFSSYQLFPLENIPASIPTRSRLAPKQDQLSLHLTDAQKMLLEFGLKPTALVGDTLMFSKGISEKEIESLFSGAAASGHTGQPHAFYMRWKTSDPHQALRRAAFEFGPDDIETILKNNEADINSQDNNPKKNYTALHIALIENKIDNALYLLEKGAKYDIKDAKGKTALAYAIEKSMMPILVFISRQIMRFYNVDDMGKAFRLAANGNNINYLQVFIKLGFDVNEAGPSKKTALHYAAQNGHEDSVLLLLQNGAHTELLDVNKKTALDYAKTPQTKALLNAQKNKSSESLKN